MVFTMAELERVGLSATRIPAVDGRLLEMDASGNIPGFKKRSTTREHYYRGAAGCYFSHIRAIQQAIIMNEWPCLIIEDDINIEGTEPLLLPDTSKEIIYFGGYDVGEKVYATHAICYKTREAAVMILDHLIRFPACSDHSMILLWQKTNAAHFARPYRIWQRDGYSLIEQRIRTYNR